MSDRESAETQSRGIRPLLIKGGTVVDPSSGVNDKRDLLVENGVICAVDKPGQLKVGEGVEVVDAAGLIVTPGLHDIHVHLREPGQEWKETVLTGTQAAVAGGFTTICCMPNTVPANDNASVTEFIIKQAASANLARVCPIGAITLKREGKALSPMVELYESGCVAFSDDGAPVMDGGLMRRALEYNLMVGGILTVHEEDLNLSNHFSMNESARSVAMGLSGMPGAAEDVMIARDIELARLTGGRVHFCHVSTARAVTLIKRAKEDGIPVTAEVTPQHISLTEAEVENYNTEAKMSMPLRSEVDRQAVLEGLKLGIIDCIASDHAPHEGDSKACEFDRASMGMIGLETTLSLALAKVASGDLTIERAVAALTTDPARCFKLQTPVIKVGARADLTLIDTQLEWVLSAESIRSKSKNTPLRGRSLRGRAVRTIVGGRTVYLLPA